MKKVKNLILGGGISGVSLMYFLESKETILLEQSSSLGGLCRSFQIKGFTWDYSGHFLHFKNEFIEDLIKREMGSSLKFTVKKTKIIFNKRLVNFPFQDNISQLSLFMYLSCLSSYLFRRRIKLKSFYDFILNTYGVKISNYFLVPYNEKLYSCNLIQLDKDAAGRFFPLKSSSLFWNFLFPSKRKSYNGTFYYCKNGIQELVETFARYLQPSLIKTEEKVIEINISKKQVKTNKSTYKYDNLVSTLPLNSLLKIAGDKLSLKSFDLSHNKILVFNIGFDKPTIFKSHWYYVPSKKYSFFRIGFYNNIRNETRMSLYVEISFASNESINVDDYYKKVLKELRDIGIITTHNVVAKNHVILNPAYVHTLINQKSRLKLLKDELENNNVYLLGRYAEWKYCSIEDNLVDALHLSKKLEKR